MAEGGFDAEFISMLPDDLTCIVCHLALRDPIQIASCGHRFCAGCFQNIKTFHVDTNSQLICPVDRGEIEENVVFNDQAAARAVLSLQVKCEQHEKGCAWSGDLRELEEHMEKLHSPTIVDNSKQMECLAARLEELERSMLLQGQQISCLQENLRMKDERMRQLEADFESKLETKDAEIKELNEIIISNDLQHFKQDYDACLERNNRSLSHIQTELNEIQNLYPKMGAFTWSIDDYSAKREINDSISSETFHDYLYGHTCYLSLSWFERRKSRIGIYFHIPSEQNTHIEFPFHKKVTIQCVGNNKQVKTCVFDDWVDEEDITEQISSSVILESRGDEYFLSLPELDDFIVDNTMCFVCYLT